MKTVVVLVAHGTVESLSDLPQFLLRIRRGRPVPPELLHEMEQRYRAVGGSPHLQETRLQAEALGRELRMDTRAAMRLWSPTVSDVTGDLSGADEVVLVPLAPYSVSVYDHAARTELAARGEAPRLRTVAPWGQFEELISAQTRMVRQALEGRELAHIEVILTAHSLPRAVIDSGDQYAAEFERAARQVADRIECHTTIAYQSQGASGGEWLGPTLREAMISAKERGKREVLVAPMGFLSEHIETLYDLDIEAKEQARALGLEFARVSTLRTDEGLIQALSRAVRQVLDS